MGKSNFYTAGNLRLRRSVFDGEPVTVLLPDGPLDVTIFGIIEEADVSYYRCMLDSSEICFIQIAYCSHILKRKKEFVRIVS